MRIGTHDRTTCPAFGARQGVRPAHEGARQWVDHHDLVGQRPGAGGELNVRTRNPPATVFSVLYVARLELAAQGSGATPFASDQGHRPDPLGRSVYQ